MDKLVGKKGVSRYGSKDFLFSDGLTSRSPLVEELEELERDKSDKRLERTVTALATYGGALGAVYISVKGGMAVERWIKESELADIEVRVPSVP